MCAHGCRRPWVAGQIPATLEHAGRDAEAAELQRGCEPDRPGADDHDVDLFVLRPLDRFIRHMRAPFALHSANFLAGRLSSGGARRLGR